MDDEHAKSDPRHTGLAPEKLAGLIISGAALAFAVHQAWLAFGAVVQRDIDDVASQQRVLETRITAYYEQRGPWIERIVELERKQATLLDRIQLVSERLVRVERESGTK